ncbi:hypothetical protein DFH09DRAFT_1148330 [Mycena vulgaris]|nr:hypothetical protein DFH09DRAFT_1148330 [Mycena vulgaris]
MEFEDATRLWPEWDRQFKYGLQIIQTLLQEIDFGRTNWGYLIDNGLNNAHIVQKTHELPRITEIPWCPFVDERDIEITNWVLAEDRHGVWNGKEVDLFIGWDAVFMDFVRKRMAAYKLLIERDLEHLAYRALGHVMRAGTNEICGIMTEASYGRMVEHTDKSAVYKAIAEIQRAGLLFMGIDTSRIMLTDDGQVRLVGLCVLVRQSADPVERAKELAYWHWERLETLFKELEVGPNLIPPMRKIRPTPISLPPFPGPLHGPTINVYMIIVQHGPDVGEERSEVQNAARVLQQHVHRRTNGRRIEVLVLDAPASARSLGASRPRLLARAIGPYQKPDKLVQELLRAQNLPNWTKRLTSGL